MKKVLKWIGIVVIALIAIGFIGAMLGDDTDSTSTSDTSLNDNNTVSTETEAVPEDNSMTAQQKNAVRSVKNYIGFAGFSRDGLINQLSSDAGDGYNIDDATIAVDSMDIDFNEQAGKSAKNYISIQGFSCDGLINQLSSPAGDKYTKEQAEYGAKLAGACD
ncbi:superinfection exclusion [Psychrobacter phage Psymv2]|uniref:superinfection exclusion n=1 Tax=Psychrobacter phage Psymv2 TaxID=1071177 RepID=UPI00022A37FE|nr:superinfection exclusion [Psychrobacter phage Psymv2]AEO01012.1 superinfection exclusion [Psychrobacter phage Psymv2]